MSLALSGCGSFLTLMESNPIEDDPGERTLGQILEDESIETKSMVNIQASDETYNQAHLSVVSYNGYVLIAGQVSSEANKTMATEVIRDIRGVRRIYNELEIASPSSAFTRTSDTWITTKIKSLLLGKSDIEGARVKVVTENGIVFLMGMASQGEANRITDTAASISGVQRVVQLFEIVE